jgi:uncharacterized protein YjbJ (UPF0337 family)
MNHMHDPLIKGDWNIVKGKVKQEWSKLTDDDLLHINGLRDELIGRLQKLYGRTREEVKAQVERFERSLEKSNRPPWIQG